MKFLISLFLLNITMLVPASSSQTDESDGMLSALMRDDVHRVFEPSQVVDLTSGLLRTTVTDRSDDDLGGYRGRVKQFLKRTAERAFLDVQLRLSEDSQFSMTAAAEAIRLENLVQPPFSTTHLAAAGGPPPRPPLDLLMRPLPILDLLTPPRATYIEGSLRDFIEWHFSWHRLLDLRLFSNDLFRSLRDFSLAPYLDANHPAHTDDTSQEALTTKRRQIQDEYVKMATQGRSATVVAKLLPEPDSDSVDEAFTENAADLDGLLDILLNIKELNPTIQFRFRNAKRTILLLSGDDSIEHHPISSVGQYKTYAYEGLPSLRQLFVLACRLCKVDTIPFIESVMGELCNTEEKWRKWAAPFYNSRFHDIVGHADVGQVIGADRSRGSPFVKSIAAVLEGGDILPVPRCDKVIVQLARAYMKKRTEQMMPVIEALFMVMRGHNIELLKTDEQNRPACAEGAYLGVLKAITERIPDDAYFLALSGLSVESCS